MLHKLNLIDLMELFDFHKCMLLMKRLDFEQHLHLLFELVQLNMSEKHTKKLKIYQFDQE